MTDASDFSLEPFTRLNEPVPANVCSALEKKIKAVETLLDYWTKLNSSVEMGVILHEDTAVASLLYQHDLLDHQEKQVWALKTSACQLVNLLVFQDNLFALLIKLHKKSHQFLHFTAPLVSRNLLAAYNDHMKYKQQH